MTVARAVEHDDPVAFSGHVNKTARFEILDHTTIAMQQDQRLA